MSKLLYNTQPLVIDPDLALMLGLNEAIVLQQIHYWITNNRKVARNYRNGYYWTFNTYENWQKQFPFWSTKTVKRIITSLEKKNLLIAANFNDLQIDRTKWYRIDYEALEALSNISGNGGDNLTRPWGQIVPMGTDPRIIEIVDRAGKNRKIGLHREG